MDVNKKKKVKFVNEYSREEDVNDHKDVAHPFYHCAHCEYKSIFKIEVKEHMEIEHDDRVPLAESESMIEEEDMMDAIEVWKIYKLLQRMKNKYK